MSNLPKTLTPEEQELQLELDKIASHPKLARWAQLFLDKTNHKTFGNRTQSAIEAYGLDPIVQYQSAVVMGSQNFRKLRVLAMAYYEQDGMTAAKVLDLIAAHAVAGKPKALEMLAAITDVYTPKPTVAIQNNTTINNAQVAPEEQQQFDRDFEAFIDAKYSNPLDSVNHEEGERS